MEKRLITGNGPLHGEAVIAGARNAALPVIAALAADRETSVDRVYHLDRGYANIEQKSAGLGAINRRV